MATFKMTATIYVQGVESKQDAINQIQIALDDYEDMNPGCPDIVILHDEPVETNEEL